jgi:hypothetical protein
VARSGYVLDACTRTISRNIAFGGKPLGALSFDGRHLYKITLQRKTASVIDTATEKVVRTFPSPRPTRMWSARTAGACTWRATIR